MNSNSINELASDFICKEFNQQISDYDNKYDQQTPGSKIDLNSIDYNILQQTPDPPPKTEA